MSEEERQSELKRLFEDLGFVSRPLFGPSVSPSESAKRSLLVLDGAAASFVVTVQEQSGFPDVEAFHDWSWSVDVPHHVEVVPEPEGLVLLRRWDSPGTLRRFTLPSVLRYSADFLDVLEKEGRPRALRVLQHGVRLFRLVREGIGAAGAGDEKPIRAFHCLLKAAAECSQPDFKERWLGTRTVGETAALLGEDLPEELGSIPLPVGIHEEFLRPEPMTGRQLEAGLLLRHAAGALYQEAHLELESSQLSLFSGEPSQRGQGRRKDVVYTPPGLARFLAEFAWTFLADTAERRSLTVLDPACGSGIFLAEMYRVLAEATGAPLEGTVRLVGMDVSGAAALMASLVLEDIRREMPLPAASVEVDIEPADALHREWPSCDLVLMNPPFIAWDGLGPDRQQALLRICGTGQGGRPDLAMAFISLGLKALRPGGVLATVLPAPLLETRTGLDWRQELFSAATPLLIARLRGGDIFPGVMVEPAVLVLRKGVAPEETTWMGLSEPGAGEALLRALRTRRVTGERTRRYELYETPASTIEAGSWVPRPQSLRRVVDGLTAAGSRRVGDLFEVKQGIRTGANEVFVLDAAQLRRLRRREHELFRPLAGSKTIREGRIEKSQYVFYPFGEDGPLFSSEEEVRSRLPDYFERHLGPNQRLLEGRSRHSGAWWEPLWPRTWQYRCRPKLLSAYFGLPGKFGFDATGEFVIGQGFGWLLKLQEGAPILPADVMAEDPEGLQTEDSLDEDEVTRRLGPAYLALLNSRCFAMLLSYFAPRVLGGQFDLSPRFVNEVPVPDLLSEGGVPADLFLALREAGDRIMRGEGIDRSDDLETLVAQAYGLSLDRWPSWEDL